MPRAVFQKPVKQKPVRRWRSWLSRTEASHWAISADGWSDLWAREAEGPGAVLLREFGGVDSVATVAGVGDVARARGAVASSQGQSRPAATIAVASIHGAMVSRATSQTVDMGLLSYDMILAALGELVARQDVAAIVLDLNTPGGQVALMPETARRIRDWATVKPIIAVANPLAASAGLWLAASATEFVATPSALVGSLGVLSQHWDVSKALEKAGVTTTLLTSTAAPHKAEGSPYAPLEPATRAEFQRRLDQHHAEFAGAVAAARNVSIEEANARFGGGRLLSARESLSAGLIDRIATLDQVVAGLAAMLQQGSSLAQSGSDSTRPTFSTAQSLSVQSVSASLAQTPPLSDSFSQGEIQMEITADLRSRLVAVGMAATATDAEARVFCSAWCAGRGLQMAANAAAMIALLAGPAPQTPAAAATPAPAAAQVTAPVVAPAAAAAPAAALAPQLAAIAQPLAQGASAQDIIATIQLTPLDAQAQMDLIGELTPRAGQISHSEVTRVVGERSRAVRQPSGATVAVTVDATDRFHAEARNQIVARAFTGQAVTQIYDLNSDSMVAWQAPRQSALSKLPRIIEQALILHGVTPLAAANLISNPVQMMRLLSGQTYGLGISAEAAANTRSLYNNVFFDAANVVMRRGYDSVNTTFQRWAAQDESFSDFKPRHSVILGEIPEPKVIPEDGEFEEVQMVDGRETWTVKVWGLRFSQTWQMTIDDRLGAFRDTNTKLANSMRRKQNQLAYNVLKANANLSDGTALFASRSPGANDFTGYAAPSHASMAKAELALAEQTGLSTEANMSLTLNPAFMLLPPALSEAGRTLLGSQAKPDQSNPNVTNIYQGAVEVIVDGELGTNQGGSNTTHYVLARASEVDTVKYAFLNGTERPVIEQQPFFERMGMAYRMYQVFGCTPVDYRGMVRLRT
jgi:signal peptide peptidase SppA